MRDREKLGLKVLMWIAIYLLKHIPEDDLKEIKNFQTKLSILKD